MRYKIRFQWNLFCKIVIRGSLLALQLERVAKENFVESHLASSTGSTKNVLSMRENIKRELNNASSFVNIKDKKDYKRNTIFHSLIYINHIKVLHAVV